MTTFTITEETVDNMTAVEKAKLQIEMLTHLALCEYYKRKVAKLTLKEVSYSLDIQPQKTLLAARDTLVDAYEEQCIPEIIAECVKQHNAKIDAKVAEKQAKADALTETEIAHLFDDFLNQTVDEDIDYRNLSCSLEVYAAISENSDVISYVKYYSDDQRITYSLLRDFCDAVNSDDAFCDIENMLLQLRSDFSDAVANKDWEELEDIKERISRISF